MTREITYRPLSDLRADPRNPKAHAADLLDESVSRFGFVEPIVLDGRTGYIISGHGRAASLVRMRDAGDRPPEGITPLITGDGSWDGEWLVPVVDGWSSRSDAEAHAALVALNRTTELGGWDDPALLDLLDGLGEAELPPGFGEEDLDELRARLDEEAEEPAPGQRRASGRLGWLVTCPNCEHEFRAGKPEGV